MRHVGCAIRRLLDLPKGSGMDLCSA